MRWLLVTVILWALGICLLQNHRPASPPPLLTVTTLGPANLAQSYAALQVIVSFHDDSRRRLACDVQMDTGRTGDANCWWLEP